MEKNADQAKDEAPPPFVKAHQKEGAPLLPYEKTPLISNASSVTDSSRPSSAPSADRRSSGRQPHRERGKGRDDAPPGASTRSSSSHRSQQRHQHRRASASESGGGGGGAPPRCSRERCGRIPAVVLSWPNCWALALVVLCLALTQIRRGPLAASPLAVLEGLPAEGGAAPAVPPTGRIVEFLEMWRGGRCDALGESLPPTFEYVVTDILAEDSAEPQVLGKEEFLQFCKPWEGKFMVDFLSRQDLGHFGLVATYVVEIWEHPRPDATAPCLATHPATISTTLSADGALEFMRETVDDVPGYNYYVGRCSKPGGATPDGADFPEGSLSQVSHNILRLFWGGECDGLARYLAPTFTYATGHAEPTGEMDAGAFLELCRASHISAPRAMMPAGTVADGSTVTVSGPSVAWVPGGRDPCVVFFEQSLFFNFTSSDADSAALAELRGTFDSAFYEEAADCIKPV